MKARFQGWVTQIRERIDAAIAQRIVWLTGTRCDQTGEKSERPAIVGVIGREHYEERRKTYPIRSYRELDRALRLELQGAPTTLTFVGPVIEDRREVAFFELNKSFDPAVLGALFWFPESLLVARGLAPNSIGTVEREGVTYFVSASGASQLRGGALRSAELFALAIGVPAGQIAYSLEAADVRASLLPALKSISLSTWLRAASPDIDAAVRKHWKPVAVSASATFFCYMIFASAYLAITTKLRERELAKLGPEVSVLIEKQHEVERFGREQAAISKLLHDQKPVYVFWSLAADVWKRDGVLLGLSYVDGRAIVRGRSKVATDVLSEVSGRRDVAGAKFDSPIRLGGEGMDQQDFNISVRFVDPPAAAEAPRG